MKKLKALTKQEIIEYARIQINARGYGNRKWMKEIWCYDPECRSMNYDPNHDLVEMFSWTEGLKKAKEGDVLDIAIYKRFPPFGRDDVELHENIQITIEPKGIKTIEVKGLTGIKNAVMQNKKAWLHHNDRYVYMEYDGHDVFINLGLVAYRLPIHDAMIQIDHFLFS